MTLTKPAISVTDFEKSVNDLWYEFLNGLFGGETVADRTHNVGRFQNVEFPECKIGFQRSPIVQGENKPEILITWLKTAKFKCFWANRDDGIDKIADDKLSWILWVKASGNNRRSVCRGISDKLYFVLNNRSATKPLVEKGLYGMCASTPMLVTESSTSIPYEVRNLSVESWCRFELGLDYE